SLWIGVLREPQLAGRLVQQVERCRGLSEQRRRGAQYLVDDLARRGARRHERGRSLEREEPLVLVLPCLEQARGLHRAADLARGPRALRDAIDDRLAVAASLSLAEREPGAERRREELRAERDDLERVRVERARAIGREERDPDETVVRDDRHRREGADQRGVPQ